MATLMTNERKAQIESDLARLGTPSMEPGQMIQHKDALEWKAAIKKNEAEYQEEKASLSAKMKLLNYRERVEQIASNILSEAGTVSEAIKFAKELVKEIDKLELPT